LNKATISGIDVIFTLIAKIDPITPPVNIAEKINTGLMIFPKVTNKASNMPRAEITFPLTAVSSLPSIFNP